MKDRKLHVIKMAHQLFIDKGYQATSIQDILDYSGISKGTFYNYFSSKSELLMAIFQSIYEKIEQERNELLIGQDRSNIEIFIKQIDLQMQNHRMNKLFSLFQEAVVLNDPELNQFFKQSHFKWIHWIYKRFIDIFGDDKKQYLLDCAIMFTGILQQNLKYYEIINEDCIGSIQKVTRYSVERIVNIVEDVSKSKENLIDPENFENILQSLNNNEKPFKEKIYRMILELKMALQLKKEQKKYMELLDFVHDELFHSNKPRKFLIESALQSLKNDEALSELYKNVEALENLLSSYWHESKGKSE
ncbi:TetR/AcrR family transcriptional regulator [Calidifontibacillus erzurumensis]|uniref:TetR/AcrR family transcriptional regulator n=1 Tax=Calidifontibacillus erzurumensis TaxID=2741433 RepID=A0A8J8GG54_9BACI|nr:TetR/AcrR family transcriptional regulator [Calidifontibacillus erzurumensis]NSL52526.1 TetR/AcrR family transcriptional regulator [Calidifontibacillus erzurumensis]